MLGRAPLGAPIAAFLIAGSWAILAQDAKPDAPPTKPNPTAIVDAVAALGGGNLVSIRYSGAGSMAMADARADAADQALFPVERYEVSIDYPASAMQIDVVPKTAQPQTAGGAMEAHRIESINGSIAWDETFSRALAAAPRKGARAKATDPQAAPAAEAPRLNDAASLLRRQAIWMTPHGFLKAALANQPALQPAGAGTEVSFYAGTHRYVGFLNSRNQVERVRTWIRRPEQSDVLLDTSYTEYQTFGPVSFPTHIVQLQNGRRVLDVVVTSVQANAKVRVPVPAGLGVS